MTAGDLAVVSNLVTYHYCGFKLDRSRFGRLAKYFDRMVGEPSIRDTLRKEKPVVASMGLNDEIFEAEMA